MIDELMAAIVAAPDDDAPRLVYADRAMQAGDPHGELVSLQIAIAKADAADEPISTKILARERELVASMPAIPGYPAHVEYRRGFIEHAVIATPTPVTDEVIAAFDTHAPLLRSIALPGAQLGGPAVATWSRFEALALHECVYLTDRNVADFVATPLPNLRKLHVLNATFDADAIRALFGLRAPLTAFGFTTAWAQEYADPSTVGRFLATCDWPLESLLLGHVTVEDLGFLTRFPLRRLALRECKLRKLPPLPDLHTLEIDKPTGEFDFAALLKGCPNLRRLRVRNVMANAPTVSASIRKHAANLRRLDLGPKRKLPALGSLVPIANTYVRPLPPVDPTVRDEMKRKQRIAAIKAHRELTRAGLLESKLAVERIAADHGYDDYAVPSSTWLQL